MEFKKRFEMTLNDYLHFNFFFSRKRLIITPIVFFVLVPVVFVLMGIIRFGKDWTLMFTPSIFAVYAVLALTSLLSVFALRRAARKQYESSRFLRAEIEISINDSGINQSSKAGSSVIEWKDIYKAEESKYAFYLFIAVRQALIIPKRIISTEEDSNVRKLIRDHISSGKNRLKS